MKKSLVLLTIICCTFQLVAQDKYTLTIKDTKGMYLSNVEVTATNKSANDILKGKTNMSGKVVFEFTKVGTYIISYLDVSECDTYEVEEGGYGSGGRTVTYDPKKIFAQKPKGDRSGISFTNVPGGQLKGKPGISELTIELQELNGNPVGNSTVELVAISEKTKYTGQSNSLGNAVFYVPCGKTYEVDVDGIQAMKVVSLSNDTKLLKTETVYYQRTKLSETTKGDTIVQQNITQTNGTNTHWLFTVNLEDYESKPLNNEPVYLVAQSKKRVYKGITNEQGICKFMLEKTADYVVNLKYEQGLHLVEASKANGFGKESITRRYRGSKEIERILAEQEAEMKRIAQEDILMRQRREEEERIQKLEAAQREKAEKELREKKKKTEKALVESFYAKKFIPTFSETPTHVAKEPTDYLKTTPGGYQLHFKSSGEVGTPTIVNDQLFTPAGFYSTSFYCLNANNGKYIWGLELGESGASPGVYHNGVILINTYSCTLYAIDATTGKLLWSKWLAGAVYSTPTADGDKVYVVYHYGSEYVLSCFDLRSGEFKWINQVDSETIACPVVEGDQVHVASQTGFYYVFDKTSGKPIEVVTAVVAVSSPTITPTGIFITTRIDNGKDRLVELDRKTFEIKKSYPAEIYAQRMKHDCQDQMNFNGTHPVVYKNKYVVLTDEKSVKVVDTQSEKMIWEKPFDGTSSQVPIVADNQVILGTTDGKILSFDIATGQSKTLCNNASGTIKTQPVSHKGKLFIGGSGILLAVPLLQNIPWTQWNKDARHNLYIQ